MMDALIGLASGGALAAIKNAMEHGGEALKDAIEAAGKHVRKCTNCFVAGTLVATACGLVPIEEVQASDWVWARDEVTGEVRLCEVEETYRNESPVILEVTVGGETLATIPGHPFWVLEVGWKDAGDLEVGDRLVNLRGESVVVEDIRRRPVPEAVYNFSVDGLHTYFVGQGGIWVHNNSGAGCGVPGAAAKTPLTVNESTIATALEGSTMQTAQGKVSLPVVEAYVRKLEAGEVPPAIRVDGSVIVEGNHRYVAGRVYGTEPPVAPGTMSPSQAPKVKPIQETVVDPNDWGNR